MANQPVIMPELSAWNAEILRCTAFHQSGMQMSDNNWWEETTQAVPESKTMKPREGGYEVFGSYGGGTLTLRADALRFDWLLTPVIQPEKVGVPFASVGTVPDAINTFLPLMKAWLLKTSAISRLAFGAVANQNVPDRVAGYRVLDTYMKAIDIDPDGSSEFAYSINRPRTAAGFGGIRINRLSRWSVALGQPMTLTLGLGQLSQLPIVGQAIHALRSEVDISTDATRSEPLLSEHLSDLFEYLVRSGEEILREGDIK